MSVAAVEPETPPADPASDDPAADPAEETTPADAPADPAAADPTEQPAEGAEKPDIEPAAAVPVTDIPEETLKAAATKYANKTMAAARRAEQRVADVQRENATYKGHLQTYAGFVERLQKGDVTALREIGFNTVREFLDRAANFGDPDKAPAVETRIEALERQLREREDKAAREMHERTVAESQRLVFAHVDGDKARWRYTSTEVGHEQLWDALGEYFNLHGDVPDAAVPHIADAVEKHLRAQFGADDSGQRRPAKNGASPPQPAASGGRNSGKTLTNRGSSGAPAQKRYSDNDEERTRQIMEEMRAAGELG